MASPRTIDLDAPIGDEAIEAATRARDKMLADQSEQMRLFFGPVARTATASNSALAREVAALRLAIDDLKPVGGAQAQEQSELAKSGSAGNAWRTTAERDWPPKEWKLFCVMERRDNVSYDDAELTKAIWDEFDVSDEAIASAIKRLNRLLKPVSYDRKLARKKRHIYWKNN